MDVTCTDTFTPLSYSSAKTGTEKRAEYETNFTFTTVSGVYSKLLIIIVFQDTSYNIMHYIAIHVNSWFQNLRLAALWSSPDISYHVLLMLIDTLEFVLKY